MWFDMNYVETPFKEDSPLTEVYGMIQCLGVKCYYTLNLVYKLESMKERDND